MVPERRSDKAGVAAAEIGARLDRLPATRSPSRAAPPIARRRIGVVLLAGLVAADWRPVSAKAAALTLLVTMVQTAALASIAAALHRGEASRLAPWQFSGLLWAMALDALSFQVAPTTGGLIGGGLVIGGGVLAQLSGRSPTAGTASS